MEAAWHPYHFLADAALVGRRVRPPVVVGTVAGRVGHARCLALGSSLSAFRFEVDLDVSAGAIASRKRDEARRGCRTIALPTRAVALRAGCYRASVANPEAAGRMCVRAASVTVWNEEIQWVGERFVGACQCGVNSLKNRRHTNRLGLVPVAFAAIFEVPAFGDVAAISVGQEDGKAREGLILIHHV